MKLLGNIIWLIFGGFFTALQYFAAGIALAITIIGLPFAFQSFKLGLMMLAPFSQEAVKREDGHGFLWTLMNIIWFFVGGFWISLAHLLIGILCYITIIGIPFGTQHFKLMKVSWSPFGRDIVAVG